MKLSNARRHISLILRIAHNYSLRYVISMDNSLARRSPKGRSLLKRVPFIPNWRWLAATSEGMGSQSGKNGTLVNQEQDVPESIDLSFQLSETTQVPARPPVPKTHPKSGSDLRKKFRLVRTVHSSDQALPRSRPQKKETLYQKENIYEEEYDLTKNWPGLIKLIVCMAVSAWIGTWLAQWIRGAA